MQFPLNSRVLQRHRLEDERGLHFNWQRYTAVLGVMREVSAHDPLSHVSDPVQALQDAYADALHTAWAVQVTETDLTVAGGETWDGTPVWLEFEAPRTFGGGPAFEGALVFHLPVREDLFLLFPILLSKTVEQAFPTLYTGHLPNLLGQVTPGEPLHEVLTALTHLPVLLRRPRRHESSGILTERLTRHLKRVKHLAPRTLEAIPRHYLRERQTWDARVFVPTPVVAAALCREGLPLADAILQAPEVAVLGTWRYAKQVIQLDEDVLDSLRRAKPPARLPSALPGLRSHAVYVPVPGGLGDRRQTGFFASLDDVDGQVRLLLLIESRAYGSTVLSPVSLPLDTDIQTELRSLAGKPGTNYREQDIEQVHRDLALALLCIAYIGSSETTLTGPGQLVPAQPRKGKNGKQEFVEASGVRTWEAGLDVGQRLRAYRVQAARSSSRPETGTGTGRTMPPHLRAPHAHGYWTGPGRTQYEIKFLDLIAVNMDREEGLESPVRLSEI